MVSEHMVGGETNVKSQLRYITIRLLLILLVINLWMYFQQPAITFYPYRELMATPVDWQLDYEEVSLTTADGVRLHGWYLPQQGGQEESRRALLFLHGNGGNISHRGESLTIFHRLGFNVFIFDYRGYGQSEGKPGEEGIYKDAKAAWRYLVEQRGFAPTDIVMFGRSLGGAVASRLAAEVRPGALILESTFSSARELAQALFPVLSRIVVMRYDFKTSTYLRQVHCPVMVVHSPDDDIIPFHLGQKVYAAANPPKSFTTLRGDHNSGFLISQPDYEESLAEFIATQLPRGETNPDGSRSSP